MTKYFAMMIPVPVQLRLDAGMGKAMLYETLSKLVSEWRPESLSIRMGESWVPVQAFRLISEFARYGTLTHDYVIDALGESHASLGPVAWVDVVPVLGELCFRGACSDDVANYMAGKLKQVADILRARVVVPKCEPDEVLQLKGVVPEPRVVGESLQNGDEQRPSKSTRVRGTTPEMLESCRKAMVSWLDHHRVMVVAAEENGIYSVKTLKRHIEEVLDIVDDDTRRRWIPHLRVLKYDKWLGKWKDKER